MLNIEMCLMVAVFASVIGVVYTNILIQDDHILSWLDRLLYRIKDHKYFWWIYKIHSCELCLSGQIAMWTYLMHAACMREYNIVDHIFSIFAAILFAKTISKYIND